ncbi:MAG: hypothetical protein WC919_08010 [Candidatus Paceibacterota bacterium]|jgi:hypothetical protein
MKHTETPWEVKSTATKSSFAKDWREIFAGRRPVVISAAYDSSSDGAVSGVQISEDDANFIVCACNCHENLLQVVMMLLRDIQADPAASAYFDLRHILAAKDAISEVKKYTRQ